ncbi:MAG: molybdopterin-dependent oxidoreductase [Spirochaetaceae bacterium]|jgi:CO/xanthine dehydrogenase Mo-binding subunit|nr:molybdopterin-dependent oxidoreductase [Spirochaetaceae bacterium]
MRAKRSAPVPREFEAEQAFYSDLSLPGMYYARLVRSVVSAGTVDAVLPADLPDGYTLFTAADLSKRSDCAGVLDLGDTAVPVLASEVSYLGEPIAMLMGPDPVELGRLVKTIVIMMGGSRAGQGAAELVHREIVVGNDLLGDVGREGDVTVNGFYRISLKSAVCPECAGAMAAWKDNTLTIFAATEWPQQLRKALAGVFGIPGSKITIKETLVTEENSNALWQTTVLASQAALAARVVGKPVQLALDRAEHDVYVRRGMYVTVSHKTVAARDGALRSMAVKISVNSGAYNPFSGEILDRLVIAAAGAYRPAKLRIRGTVYKTRMPPAGTCISLLDGDAFFAVENQIDKIARALNMTPMEVREKNLPPRVPPGVFDGRPAKAAPPKSLVFPFDFRLAYYHDVLTAVCAASDYKRKYSAYSFNVVTRQKEVYHSLAEPVRGIGLAAAFSGSGFFASRLFNFDRGVEVMQEHENSVFIRTQLPSRTIRGIWTAIASQVLEVSPDQVHFEDSGSPKNNDYSPGLLLNNSVVMTSLVRKCCKAIQKQRSKAPFPLRVRREITRAQRNVWDQENFSGTPFFSTASGAAVVEVDIDQYTNRGNVSNIWLSIDCGAIYTAREIEKTVRRAVQSVLYNIAPHVVLGVSALHVAFVPSENEAQQIGNLIYKIVPAAWNAAMSQAFYPAESPEPAVRQKEGAP